MRRMRHVALLVVVLVACKEDKQPPKPDPAKPVEVEPSVAAEPLPKRRDKETTAAALGKTPAAPFGKIAKIKLGMPEADAKAALPELFAGGELVDEENALSFKPIIEQGKLWRIEVKSTSLDNMEKLAAEAWGAGTVAKGTIGDVMYWWDPATNTRAMADSSDLDLQYYVPLEQLLGEPGKVEMAALPKPILGITPEQLAENYGAQYKHDGKLHHIYLPPTEFEREHVSVFVMHSDRKKTTTDYSFELSYEATKDAKAQMIAAFEKKWGEPKLAKSYGSDDEDMIFHKKKPLIYVGDVGHSKSLRVSVRPIDDGCGSPCYKGL